MSDSAVALSEKEICNLIDSVNNAGVVGFAFIVDAMEFEHLLSLKYKYTYSCIYDDAILNMRTYWLLIVPHSIESYTSLALFMNSNEFSLDVNGFIINVDKNYDADTNIRKFDLLLKLRHDNLITGNLPRILA